MPIKYYVESNNFQLGSYHLKTEKGQLIPTDWLVKDLVSESTVSEVDVYAVLSALQKQIEKHLLQGNRPIIEGLATFSVAVNESVNGLNEVASTSVKVRVNARVDSQLKKVVANNATLEKVYKQGVLPMPVALIDVASKSNNVYTAGNMARLNGDKMEFNSIEKDEGIFFIAITDGSETHIESYAQTGSKDIIFLIPAGITGEFRLEVRTRYRGKILKTGRMKQTITAVK